MDIRKIVHHAFPNEEVHVTVQTELLCCFVYLMCPPDEFDDDEQTHQCTENDLDNIYNLGPNGGRGLYHTKRQVRRWCGNRYMIEKTSHVLLIVYTI